MRTAQMVGQALCVRRALSICNAEGDAELQFWDCASIDVDSGGKVGTINRKQRRVLARRVAAADPGLSIGAGVRFLDRGPA